MDLITLTDNKTKCTLSDRQRLDKTNIGFAIKDNLNDHWIKK